MKIDYTKYCEKELIEETDLTKQADMLISLKDALKAINFKGRIGATYYTDGTIKVILNGEYYNMFDANTGKFFGGFVGDYK